MYLTRYLYAEYMKNSFNSKIKKDNPTKTWTKDLTFLERRYANGQ